MQRKKSILTFIIILFFSATGLVANEKLKIIENINNLKRPHFLKCIYEDKKQKELIVNRKNLVIYHKKYNKTYFYPVSKSYFADILDKKKFENLILDGDLRLNEEIFEIKHSSENKGEIIFFFDKESFNLSGWQVIDLNGNNTNFKISNLDKNQNLDKKLFNIPIID